MILGVMLFEEIPRLVLGDRSVKERFKALVWTEDNKVLNVPDPDFGYQGPTLELVGLLSPNELDFLWAHRLQEGP